MRESLPLFPLATVLVPGEVIPLHIFEPRYRDLFAELVGEDLSVSHRPHFGVIARRGDHHGAERAGLHDVGCSAEILQLDRHPDGTCEVVAVGRRRFALGQAQASSSGYLIGLVDWLEEPVSQVPTDLLRRVQSLFSQYCQNLGIEQPTAAEGSSAVHDPTMLSYLVTGTMLAYLPERQQLLAAPDALTRLTEATRLLRREVHLWQVLPSVPATDLAQQPALPN